jgi:hypothetical protein
MRTPGLEQLCGERLRQTQQEAGGEVLGQEFEEKHECAASPLLGKNQTSQS